MAQASTQTPDPSQRDSVLGIPLPWFVVAIASSLLFFCMVNSYTFGVFFKPMSEQLDLSRGAFSGAYSMRSIFACLAVAPIGYLADRYGARRVLVPSFILLAAGSLLTAAVTRLWQLYVIQAIFMGIGAAAPWACLTGTIGKWHTGRRALALGIVAAGSGVSSIVFPPLASRLIVSFGWQKATLLLGLVILAIGVPFSLLIKEPPRKSAIPPARTRGPLHAFRLMPRFLKTSPFLQIFMMFFLSNTAGWVVMTHFVNYATDSNIAPLVAAAMVSLLGLGSATGRMAFGFLGDRLGAKKDVIVCFALLSAGTALLMLLRSSQAGMWVAAAVFGIGFGGGVALTPTILAELFGTSNLSTMTGMNTVAVFAGTAFGPWLGGFVFDVTGSYIVALGIGTALALAAMVIAISLPPPSQERRARAEALLS